MSVAKNELCSFTIFFGEIWNEKINFMHNIGKAQLALHIVVDLQQDTIICVGCSYKPLKRSKSVYK